MFLWLGKPKLKGGLEETIPVVQGEKVTMECQVTFVNTAGSQFPLYNITWTKVCFIKTELRYSEFWRWVWVR